MERFKIDDEAAFQMLVTASQDTNLKLTAVAQWLTENARTTGGSGPNLELDSTLSHHLGRPRQVNVENPAAQGETLKLIRAVGDKAPSNGLTSRHRREDRFRAGSP